jgi:phosphomevalonate kinase
MLHSTLTHRNIAESYWAQLDSLNKQLPLLFDKLRDFEKEDSRGYKALMTSLSTKKLQDCQETSTSFGDSNSSVSTMLQNVLNTQKAFLEIRNIFRDVSGLADVPIEPKEQTELLDACMDLPGVLLAGVPGGTVLSSLCFLKYKLTKIEFMI